MINSEKLKLRAKELRIRQSDIAESLSLRQSTINQKLNNRRPMTLNEAEKLANLLRIPDEQFASYFFM